MASQKEENTSSKGVQQHTMIIYIRISSKITNTSTSGTSIHALQPGEHVLNSSRTKSGYSQQRICLVLYSLGTSMSQKSNDTSSHKPTMMNHHTKASSSMP